MSATLVSILLSDNGREAKRLALHLEYYSFNVQFIPEDYVILAKIDKTINKYQFQNYCIGFSEVIDSINVSPTEDTNLDDLKKDLGFITADELLKK